MTAQHALGPWSLDIKNIGVDLPNHVPINAPAHSAIAQVVWVMDDDKHMGRNSPKCEATAHRIVAAMNFCEGLSTDLLKATTATQALGDTNRQLAALKAINAELVATMKEVVRISDRQHDAWGAARAAIHKAEAHQ